MFNKLLRNTASTSKQCSKMLFNQSTPMSSRTFGSSAASAFNSSSSRQHRRGYDNNNSSTNNSRRYKWLFGGSAIASFALTSTILALEDRKDDAEKPAAAAEEKAPIAKPEDDHDIEKFKYVIIGGGTAAYYAVDKILENDKQATILVISKEYEVPYQRPPLSKNLWQSTDPDVKTNLNYSDWSGAQSNIHYEPESVYGNDVLQFIRNKKVVDLHVDGKVVLLNDGTLIAFDKCLIATGGEPRKFESTASDDPRITTYRTVEDFRNLYDTVKNDQVKHITIIGGGFLGSEITCSINDNQKDKKVAITQVFPEDGVLGLVLPDYLSKYATDRVKNSGVDVQHNRMVKDITKSDVDNRLNVQLDNGQSITTDHVVVAVGITPNTDVAKSTTLEVDPINGGYVVNAELQARSNIYVAGDVASYYDYNLGRRRRVEHQDHAKATGELAGKNMTGGTEPYTYQPFFWSDLTDHIGFEAVGDISAKLKTFAVWEKPKTEDGDKYGKGIIYYLNDHDKVVGVLGFRAYGKMDKARELIKRGKPVTDFNELQHQISLEDEHH